MTQITYLVFSCVLFSFLHYGHFHNTICYADKSSKSCKSTPESDSLVHHLKKRYLLYEVNPGEGFNLRRDVYMRVATVVKKLNEDSNFHEWILVLPPWGPLYHWKSKNIGFQAQIKWSTFFDISNLSEYVPVIELEDFLNDNDPEINAIYYLQHYAEGWENDKWEEKLDIRECIEPLSYTKMKNGKYSGWFWGFDDIVANEVHCLSVQGYSSTLKKFLVSLTVKTIMIDRAEVILHDAFGDSEYWMVRKSMTFSKDLIDIANAFRKEYLNSTDEEDKTELKKYSSSSFKRTAVGGPYIGVHLRRQDFAHSRSKDVPSIKHAAGLILQVMKKLELQLVFVASDAPESEFKEFQTLIPSAVRFVPDKKLHQKILDGGVAIIDQWICSHSRYFIGTYESTFSFRIQEEREILGFPIEMTFNRLCGNDQTICKQPSRWTIVHK